MKRIPLTAVLAVLTFVGTQTLANDAATRGPGQGVVSSITGSSKIILTAEMPDTERPVSPGGPDSADLSGPFLVKFELPKGTVLPTKNKSDNGDSDARIIQVVISTFHGDFSLEDGNDGTGVDLGGSINNSEDAPEQVQAALEVLWNNQVALARDPEDEDMHQGGFLPYNRPKADSGSQVAAASADPEGDDMHQGGFLPYNKPSASEVQTAQAVVKDYISIMAL